jgi:hypothetical protein
MEFVRFGVKLIKLLSLKRGNLEGSMEAYNFHA